MFTKEEKFGDGGERENHQSDVLEQALGNSEAYATREQ